MYLRLVLLFVLMTVGIAANAQINMTGTVKAPGNEALIGALLTVEGSKYYGITNGSGQYNITLPDDCAGKNLVVSYYGYKNDTIPVAAGNHDFLLENRALDEFVDLSYVTTQKKLQSNWDVPITLSVTNGNKLVKYNIQDPQELSLYVPGYHCQMQSAVYSVNVIRGVPSDGSNSYSFFQPRISVFIDGVSVTHMGTASQDIFDMQQAEVAKGPQGTLFGKGAEFGAISYITNKPVNRFEATAQASYGSYNQKIFQCMVNTPITPRLVNRFSLYYNDRNGYNTNMNPNAKDDGLSGKGALSFRDIIRWNPKKNIKLTLTVDYERDREPSTSYKGKYSDTAYNVDAVPWHNAYLDASDYYDLSLGRDKGGISYVVEHDISTNLFYSSTSSVRAYKTFEYTDLDGTPQDIATTYEKQKGIQFSQEVRLNYDDHDRLSGFLGASYMYDRNDHEFSILTDMTSSFPKLASATIKNVFAGMASKIETGLSQALDQVMSNYYKMLPEYADDMKPVVEDLKMVAARKLSDGMAQMQAQLLSLDRWSDNVNIYSQTVDLVSNVMLETITDVLANNSIASEFAKYIDPENVVEGLGIGNICSDLAPYSNLHFNPDHKEYENDVNVYHEASLFADATYKLSDKLSLTLGLRGAFERQKNSYYSTTDSIALIRAIIYLPTINGNDTLTYWLHDTELSWVGRAVLSYKLNKTNNIYLTISKGRRPGNAYYNFDTTKAIEMQPETSLNYEFGFKGAFLMNHITYTLATYHYDWLHMQYSAPVVGTYGIRSYVPSSDGKASANGVELSLEAYFRRISAFFDYSHIDAKYADKDMDGNDQLLAGQPFRMTPKNTVDLGLDVQIPVKKLSVTYIRPSFSWVDDMYFQSDASDPDMLQEAYGVFNMNIGFAWSHLNTSYDIGLYGKNILNAHYLLSAGNQGMQAGYNTYIAAAPAMFGISFRVQFR